MLSESARASSSVEARFRIQAPPPTARTVTVIPLDAASERLTTALAAHEWRGVTFVPASAAALFARDPGATDLVMMVVTAGTDASAVVAIGETCSERRIPTATCVTRDASTSDDDLSATLGRIRPWSLMVVVVGDGSYLEDILRSLR
jgi:hypothetical protein